MSTPGPASKAHKTERRQSDGEVRGQGQPVHFATFSAHNAAAVHLLEAVQASGASPCLVSDEDTISYYLALPSAANRADFTQPAADRWRLGAGPSTVLTEKGVDHCKAELLLCPPGHTPGSKRARSSIKDVHAVISFHPASGVLVLRNIRKQPIVYRDGDVNGHDFTIYGDFKGQDSCILFRPRNKIRFGEYEFVLDIALDPRQRDQFLVQRDTLLLRTHNSTPSRHLAPIPTNSHFRLWNVRVHQAIVSLPDNPQDTIYYGVQLHTGIPVAVKSMRYDKATLQRARREIEVASIFGADHAVTGVLGSLESWCEHGVSPPCWLESQTPDEDVFYSMPLAEYNFETMPWAKLSFQRRSHYLHQTLRGLSEFHKKGIVHGRIRPTSLLILPRQASAQRSEQPEGLPEAASISSAVSSPNDEPGVAIWVAPEVSSSTDSNPYTKEADVWALAVSWLQAFAVIPNDVGIDAGSYRQILKTLDTLRASGKITDTLQSLLLQMLAWKPEDRPSVTEAMSHAAWAPVKREMELRNHHIRQHREERKRGPDEGLKKIGIISNVGFALEKCHSAATRLLIALGFTLLETYTISAISSMFETSIILSTVVLTVCVFVFITAFASFAKYDFTHWLPWLFGGLLGLILFAFIAAFYPYNSIKELIYGGMAALILCSYIRIVTRLVLQRHHIKRIFNVTILLFLHSNLGWQNQREEVREFISNNICDDGEDIELGCMGREKRVLLDQNKPPADLGGIQLPRARASRACAPSRDGLESILLLSTIPEIYAKWEYNDLMIYPIRQKRR